MKRDIDRLETLLDDFGISNNVFKDVIEVDFPDNDNRWLEFCFDERGKFLNILLKEVLTRRMSDE